MAFINKTEYLNLPQWEASEKPSRTDFNEAFEKIDTTLESKLNAKSEINIFPVAPGMEIPTCCYYFKTTDNVVTIYGTVKKQTAPLKTAILLEPCPLVLDPKFGWNSPSCFFRLWCVA